MTSHKGSDSNPPAPTEAGLFGLAHTPDESAFVILPVPFEVTTSYGSGTSDGPSAIRRASLQVDLLDRETGRADEAGIVMLPEPTSIRAWNEETTPRARRLREGRALGVPAQQLDIELERINSVCQKLNEVLRSLTEEWIGRGKVVGCVGGDHGAVYGAIAAHAEHYGNLGILHVDAHADLRPEYEGFVWSHASIMDNVMRRLPAISRLVQVGVRDLCEEELESIESSGGRIRTYFDADLSRERFEGATWSDQVSRMVKDLPEQVYVSFDVDGLDPSFCPHTGTPVPGGLTFQQASYLLGAVARSGRRIVGFDLVEVAPDPAGGEWDANVGARLLYKLIGWTRLSQQLNPTSIRNR